MPKSRAFGRGDAHVRANGVFGNLVEKLGIDRVHAVVGERRQVVGNAQMLEIVLGIDLDGVVRLHEGVADGVFHAPADPGFVLVMSA